MLISNPKAADGYRSANIDSSGSGVVATSDASTTLVTAKSTKHTVFLQKLTISITTSAAQIITIKDSAGTPVEIGSIAASAAKGSVYTVDFGSRGYALTEGKNLLITQTAGPAYTFSHDSYQKLTTADQSTTVDRTFA